MAEVYSLLFWPRVHEPAGPRRELHTLTVVLVQPKGDRKTHAGWGGKHELRSIQLIMRSRIQQDTHTHPGASHRSPGPSDGVQLKV